MHSVTVSSVCFCCAFAKMAPGFPVPKVRARVLRERPAAVGGAWLAPHRALTCISAQQLPVPHRPRSCAPPTPRPERSGAPRFALFPRTALNVQLTPNVGRGTGPTPSRKSMYSVGLPAKPNGQ